MIYRFRDKHANHYATDEPTSYCLVHRWRVKVLVSKAVYRGFIGGVMVSVLVLKAVDCGFIGGVMISVLDSKAVDRGFIGGRLAFLSR
jgi:hypothetical protein